MIQGITVGALKSSSGFMVSTRSSGLRCEHGISNLSFAGFPETQNTKSVIVTVEKKNRFDVDALKALMGRARRGAVT